MPVVCGVEGVTAWVTYIHVYVRMCAHVHAGLREASVARETDVHLANPTLPDEVLQGVLQSLLNLVTMQCPYFYYCA